MATSYPGALDDFADPTPTSRQNAPSHAGQHKNVNDAIEAVEAELGTHPSGTEATVKARLDKIEDGTRLANDSITAPKIAANAVGSSELADNAVTAPTFAAGAMSAVLLAVARAQPVVSGGDAFDGPDPMWETIFGEPFADAGTPSAGTPAHTFDGGAAA